MQPLDTVYLQIYAQIHLIPSRLPVWMLPLYTALRKNTVHFRFFCHILRISRSFPPSNSRRSRCCSPIIS